VALGRPGTTQAETSLPLHAQRVSVVPNEAKSDDVFDFCLLVSFSCTFRGLGPLASSGSGLSPKTMNLLRHFCWTLWTEDWPIARPLPTQDSITQNVDIYPCLERDLNPIPHIRVVQDHVRPRSHDPPHLSIMKKTISDNLEAVYTESGMKPFLN
jgi:hypothetical protein